MGFDIGGAISGAATGAAIGGPWGALAGGAAGGFLGGSSGGDSVSGYGMLNTEQRMGVDRLRRMLYAGEDSPFNENFQYYGKGQTEKWHNQLLGAAQTTANPILRAVSDQVEADFARRGLSTGGAAGAAKARSLMDVAAKIALPVEQQTVSTEQRGIEQKYGLQQYYLNLALGSEASYPNQVQTPSRESDFSALLRTQGPSIAKAAGGVDWGSVLGGTNAAEDATWSGHLAEKAASDRILESRLLRLNGGLAGSYPFAGNQ